MAPGFFVTGTDTGCGKTEVSLALMAALQARGLSVLGMKPVAAGCERTAEGLRNEDALRLAAQGSFPIRHADINPYAFEPAIAPHLAAARQGVVISTAVIRSACRRLAERADAVVVEGVGGWRVPLGPEEDVGSLARVLGLPVVLAVGLRLGCLSHALLTAEAIERDRCTLAGWVGNRIDPGMDALEESLQALGERIAAPCLGVLPWAPGVGARELAGHLDLVPLAP